MAKSGRISGSPLDGLCYRMVIQTKRVFDGCLSERQNTTLSLSLDTDVVDPRSVINVCVTGARFINVATTPECDNKYRLDGDLVIDFAMTYMDGEEVKMQSASITERRITSLRLPETAMIPYAIEASAVFRCVSASFVNANTVSATGCLFELLKVTAPVDLVVPTYGYCVYPTCGDCFCNANEEVFPFFDE